MPVTILVGAQWGDEGKGRVADWLAADSDIVARYAGGDNAGHTVVVGEQVTKLRLMPSGILQDHVTCVLGNGQVVNPISLLKEMDDLAAAGIDVTPHRVILSTRAHIITPAHIALDKADEIARGKSAIGTTQRGIGPAYMDKTGRTGIRAGQMRDVEQFAEALYQHIRVANEKLAYLGAEPLNPQQAAEEYLEAAVRLRPYLQDTALYVNRRLKDGARVLCEGAQGSLLDLDHGDYPFVTSSSPTAGGALTGLGFGPMSVDRVVGVAKAYATRVGSGPMPTELNDEIADRLRGTGENFWDEYGTVTRRPRRCGWFDAVMLRYTAMINGFTELILTKLDILTGLDVIRVAVAYELDGQHITEPPSRIEELERAAPVYETFSGWSEPIDRARTAGDLPEAVLTYVKRLEALVEVPIRTLSVGPERDQLVDLSGS